MATIKQSKNQSSISKDDSVVPVVSLDLPSESHDNILSPQRTSTGTGLVDSIKSNPLFSGGLGLLAAGAGLALLRQGLNHGAQFARRQLLVTLEIPSKDKSYPWFLHWMSHQSASNNRHLAVETAFKQHDNGSISTTFSLVPGPGKHLFRWGGAWIQVERQRDSKMMDLTTGSPWETVTLTTLSSDRGVFTKLLEEAQMMAMQRQEGKTVVYTSFGPEWRPFGLPRRKRTLDSVILDDGVKERIVNDVKDFISNGNWYNERSIPYRRGYLLYGPPGSGKSSFIQALAGELDYNICILNLSERGLTDDRLNHLLNNVPERSVILLEDVDAAFTSKRQATEGFFSNVTFSGLLNALDGVASAEERIVFMTTNHVDQIDPAIIRPGRIDVKEYFGNASGSQIRRMFLRFYEGENKLAEEFITNCKGKKVSTAALQGHFVYWKGRPGESIAEINTLWRD